MNHTEAFDWLDRLLNLRADECAAVLQQVALDDPALHARLVRLLEAARTMASSEVIDRVAMEGATAAAISTEPVL
jgi:hypothetical protein